MAESIAVICRSAPLQDHRAVELAEMLVTVAVFGLPCRLVFLGDGVLQLSPDQHARGRTSRELLAPLPDYGVTDILADQQALTRYGLDPGNLLLPVTALSRDDIHERLAGARHSFGW